MTKFDIFLEGFASLTAFPAPNPKVDYSTPTLPVWSLGCALSYIFYLVYLSFWIKLLF